MITAIRSAVILPFRLVSRAFDTLGRLASLLLGFLLMIAGAAISAGPLFWLGIPTFGFGLYLTLRSLG